MDIKFMVFPLLLIAISIFSANKMPGEYLENNDMNKIFKEAKFRGVLKNGNYEVYSVVSETLDAKEIKFSVFDDVKTPALKWLEMSIDSYSSGRTSVKILGSKGLLKGKLKRFQIKYSKHYPFEIDLSKNKEIEQNVTKSFLDRGKKDILKNKKFIRNDFVQISGKKYKVKVYGIETNGKKNKIEYALLDDKDTKVLGIAYFKQKKGLELYLKEVGDNSVSIFPKKVPMLDFINRLSQMSESFMREKEMREKALAREKRLEAEKKENKVDKDDPIEKLNKMLEKEGE